MDSFKETLDSYRSMIDEALGGECVKEIFDCIDGYDFMRVYTRAFRSFTEGGKRLRAFLVMLGYRMCGREPDEDIVRASLAFELFQSGILVHDDIIDESDLRRGRPTMHMSLEGSDLHNRVSKAICVGDLGIVAATDILIKTGFEPALILKAIEHQNRVYKLTIAGELKDIELSDKGEMSGGVGMDDIVTMYELKTAWYTFIGPVQLGVILGGGSEKLMEDVREAGRCMGIAFQIRDDILGIYGKSRETGKTSLSDIEEGKKTLMTGYFTEHCTEEELESFESLYGRAGADEGTAERIGELFIKSGARRYADEQCSRYTGEAGTVIDRMEISEECREILRGMLRYLNEREA